MTQYLLSVHSVDGEARDPMTAAVLEADPAPQPGAEVGRCLAVLGRLHDPDTATVVRISDGEVLTTDGPFVEAREHLGGFYIIEAEDLDAALVWASKATAAVGKPIEVRPFAATEA